MSKSTISTFEVLQMFPDVETARVYLEERRWGGNVVCPHCDGDQITTRKGKRLGYYRCRECKVEFTVRTGTIFERSHVPLHKWIYAMYLVVTARKGISSMQMAKEIGVTQKTAWFMLGRLREACGGEMGRLSGTVEVDEAYVGGREHNKHESKKLHLGRGTAGKQPVFGLRERGGKSVAKLIEFTDQATLHAEIERHVEPGSKVYTDEHRGYGNLTGYEHGRVRHSAGEYVGANDIHTNSVESMWALLKRGLYGTWHHASRKHLGRYVNEVTFRLNEATVKVHTLQRLSAFVSRSFKHRISYEELTS